MRPSTRAEASILGLGFHLPDPTDVQSLVPSSLWRNVDYRGWQTIRRARDGKHPAVMGAAALRAALDQSGVDDLAFVISSGVSRDYPAPWSLAVEIARLAGQRSSCVGIDLTAGCVGTLTAIEAACGLLSRAGGGAAAVVCAERWNETVDYGDSASQGLWGHSDGSGAIVLAVGNPARALAQYRGAAFCTDSELNGHIRIDQGGTRQPHVTGQRAYRRVSQSRSPRDLRSRYVRGYEGAISILRRDLECEPWRIVCNQLSPSFVSEIGGILGYPKAVAVCTGTEHGHMGGVDVIHGLQRLLDRGELRGDIVAAASTTHTFGAALLRGILE